MRNPFLRRKKKNVIDFPISVYQKIMAINTDASIDPGLKPFRVIGLLEGMSEDQIGALTGNDLMRLQRKYEFVSEVSDLPLSDSFSCDGITYTLLPFSVYGQTLKDEEGFDVSKHHIVMAKVMCDSNMGNYLKKMDERAEIFQNKMPASYIPFIMQKVAKELKQVGDTMLNQIKEGKWPAMPFTDLR